MKNVFLLLLGIIVGYWILAPDNQISSDVPHKLKFSTGVIGGGESLPLVVALHGAGANEKDLVPFLENIKGNFRYISFRAPFNKGRGYTWAEGIGSSRKEAKEKYLQNLSDAAYSVAEGSDELAQRFNTSGTPILLGFSVGGQMGIYLAGVYPEYFSDIVVAAGVYEKGMEEDFVSSSRGNVHLYYGKQDPIVSLSMGERAQTALEATGLTVNFQKFEGGHTVPPEVAELISELINE